MSAASVIRLQVESALAHRIPSALTPAPKIVRPTAPTGIQSLDEVLQGGLPQGAISEIVGPECSGRTSIAFSFFAGLTQAGKICAWIDVSDAFDPVSAAAAGVDLARLLWVRCGVSEEKPKRRTRPFSLPKEYLIPKPAKKGLHGGGFGPHPRNETKGLSEAVTDLLHHDAIAARCAEPQRRIRTKQATFQPATQTSPAAPPRISSPSLWTRLEQALRATDQLLQTGGFSAIVLDMSSLAPEVVSRVPLATRFRYRAAAERTQSSILLLTQHACAKSSAALLLCCQPAEPLRNESTVFTGTEHRVEVAHRRFAEEAVPTIPRKPTQSVNAANWQSRTAWAGRR
jgi:recombination protein RecA